MRITDLPIASRLADELHKAKHDLEIASNVGLLMMTVEENGDQGKLVYTLVPPGNEEPDDAGILFEALIDVVLMSLRRKIDRLTKDLSALGVTS